MPLSHEGKEMLKKFEAEYGFKKGKEVFYAWENKHKKLKALFKKDNDEKHYLKKHKEY